MDVLKIIYKMYSNGCVSDSDDRNDEIGKHKLYLFKAFRYEKIAPNSDSKMPFPRSGHRIGSDSSHFYSFGGYNPLLRDEIEHHEEDDFWINSNPLFQELWKFNFAAREWSKFPNSDSLPMELASNALVLHKNILMVYVGVRFLI